MNKLGENFLKLDFDTELALSALDEIICEEEENYYRYNHKVSSEIEEIKQYLRYLLDEKKISPDHIYYTLEEREIQKLYDRLENIPIEFFRDVLSYNQWLLYLKNGDKSIFIQDLSDKYKVVCGKFKKLGLDDLKLLDDFFGEEPFQNISIELIQTGEEEVETVH